MIAIPRPDRRRAPLRWPGLAGSAALVLAAAAGCERRTEADRVPPPPTVTVVRAQRRDIPIVVSGIGTTTPRRYFAVRARVSGFLDQGPPELFQEGSSVQAGQLLFVIDEAPFQAAVAAARAMLDEARAQLQAAEQSQQVPIAQARLLVSQAVLFLAQIQERRYRQLLERVSITREEYDERRATLQQAEADVQAKKADVDQAKVDFESNILLTRAQVAKAQADLTNAELDLSYCRMTTPIDGRIGEARIKPGNYVSATVAGAGATDADALATVQQLDPMGIDFRPSSRYLPMITELTRQGLAVELFVQGERPYPHAGKLIFLDNRVDPTTSTFLLKAEVPNPEQALLPGDYVRVNTVIGQYRGAIVVPERAVMETQAGPIAYAVGDDGTVAVAAVRPVDTYEGLRVLEAGLQPGQRVVVGGIQLVRPGLKVQVEEIALEAAVPKVEPSSLPTRSERLESPLAVPLASPDAPPSARPAPPATGSPGAERPARPDPGAARPPAEPSGPEAAPAQPRQAKAPARPD